MYKFLVIQTAFTGDVVLATALVEQLHSHFPDAPIDFLLRKGNEQLLDNHPFVGNVLVWDKKKSKIKNLLSLVLTVRKNKYTHVINPHRFLTSGIITVLSGAPFTAGFDKNPLSLLFTRSVKHIIGSKKDEQYPMDTERNQLLIAPFTTTTPSLPKLYPTAADFSKVATYQVGKYVCIAPASVWFTKQYPAARWAELIAALPNDILIYLIGGPGDTALCESIRQLSGSTHVAVISGQLSYLESAALMQGAVMNYTNDSAPLHFASAMDAPVTAVFCSTIPQFGFGPVHQKGKIVEVTYSLPCRPCGLHGHKACPEGHFKCANDIQNQQLLWWISKTT